MFEVTFKGPVRVNAEMLSTLLALTDQPATVVPIQNGKVLAAVKEAVHANGAAQAVAVAGDAPKSNGAGAVASSPVPGKKRGRKSNAEKAAEAAAAEGNSANGHAPDGSSEPVEVIDAPPPADLTIRFTSLVDANYDAALQLLENFGVGRFSDVKPERHEAFSNALTQLGV